MARLYTISHGKGFLRTDNSYQSNLDIVNKETLVHVARRLGIEGVAKSHSKERLAGTVSGYVLSHPEECLGLFSVKELLLLKDFVDEGGDIPVTIRQCPTMQNDVKEDLIQKGREMMPTIKGVVTRILLDKGVKVCG